MSTTPSSGNKSHDEADARWRSSLAYADMIAALELQGWPDYDTANREKWEHRARWLAFQHDWQLRMQVRAGINPKSEPSPMHNSTRRGPTVLGASTLHRAHVVRRGAV